MREHTERWKQLCEQAATEQDPKKLMELTKEIIQLLEEKDKRLRPASTPRKGEQK
jgi:hypothetical protein